MKRGGRPKRKRNPIRRQDLVCVGTTEDFVVCPHCEVSKPRDSFARHESHCRFRKRRTNVEEPPNVDEGDNATSFSLGGAEDDVVAESEVDETKEHHMLFGDAALESIRQEPGASGDLLLGPQTPIGTVVKYETYRNSWMNCLAMEDEDDSDEEGLDDKNEEESVEWEDDRREEGTAGGVVVNEHIDDWIYEPHEGNGSATCLPGLTQQQEEEYGMVSYRGGISECKEFSSTRPDPDKMDDCRLKELLLSDEGKLLGCCFHVEEREVPVTLEPSEISMVRLIDYCDMKPINGRNFLDGLLDLLVEEMDERGFNPRERPRRKTISKRIMKMYGAGCEPTIAQMTMATEKALLVKIEESLPQQEKMSKKDVSGLVDVSQEDIKEANKYLTLSQDIENRPRQVVEIISFDFESMVLDLLGDTYIFGNLDHLVLDKERPYMPYKNTTGVATEMLDGSWWGGSIPRLKELKEDPFCEEVEFILPIMMYVDKTGTTMNQRYSLEPLVFTTPLIRKELRTNASAYRLFAYLPELEMKSASEKDFINRKNPGATAQAYHLALSHVLKMFEDVQNKGIVHWLRLGPYRKKVRIRPELACILNDGKSADMITTRVPSSYSHRRISRACHTLAKKADQTTNTCKFVELNDKLRELMDVVGMSAKEIQEDPRFLTSNQTKPSEEEALGIVREAKKKLDKLSFHPVKNAFVARCIRFGLDPRNIWGANPVDLMHAFQSGILMYIVKMVLEGLPPLKQVKLDRLVHKMFNRLRTKERAAYPRMNFSKGYSKLTLLTSDEWAGKLFVLLIVLQTQEGREILDPPSELSSGNSQNKNNWKKKQTKNVFQQEDIPLPSDFWDQHTEEDLHKGGSDLNKLANELVGYEDESEGDEVEEDMEARILDLSDASTDSEWEPEEQSDDDAREEEMYRRCSLNDFTHLAEALLCFHAWYKMGVPKVKDGKIDTGIIKASVARLLAMVRWYTPRKSGRGWKIQKFHDLLHLAVDIERFGPPSNFDCGPNESSLRYWAKLPALTSQTRGYNTFAKQVAMRIYEFQCFAKALRLNGLRGRRSRKKENMNTGEETAAAAQDGPILGGSRYRVYTNTNIPSEQITSSKPQGSFAVSPVIENFLRWQNKAEHDILPLSEDTRGTNFWELRTEVSFIPKEGDRRITLRCHPNYKNEGPWYDWAIVHFQPGNEVFHRPENKAKFLRNGGVLRDWDPIDKDAASQYGDTLVPSKILALAENPVTGEAMALVHGCAFRLTGRDRESDTCLLEAWRLSYLDLYQQLPRDRRKNTGQNSYLAPQLTWVALDSIYMRCLVIEEEPGVYENVPYHKRFKRPMDRVLLVRQRKDWANEF